MTPEFPESSDQPERRSEAPEARSPQSGVGGDAQADTRNGMYALPTDGPVVGYTVATVARRLGIASATLRTWARRYGLTASMKTAGAHRRYTDTDIAMLVRVQQLVAHGIPLAAAAASAISEAEGGQIPQSQSGVPAPPIRDAAPALNSSGGGVIIPIGDSSPAARGLARAASSLDSSECARIITSYLEQRGVIPTWDELIRPVLAGIGERWQRTGAGIEVEHALSHSIIAVLARSGQDLTHPVNGRPVILACAAEEQHSLPLYAIYAALAERRIAARVLGARTPAESLGRAIERTGPAAVVVWSQFDATASTEYLQALPRTRPPVTVIVAGQGWDGQDIAGATHVTDLNETVMAVQTALRV